MAAKYLTDDEVFGSSNYLSEDEVFGLGESEKKPERTWGQAAADTGVQLAEGVNTILGAVPNLVAPDSRAAEFFQRGAEYWREQQSDPLKARIAEADKAIDAAGEDGVIAQISEAAGQYFSDPALAARFVTTNLPSMIPGVGAAKLTQAAALARGASAAKAAAAATTAAGATNAALNAGGARGDAFQDIKRTLIEQGASPQEAEEQALRDSRVSAAVGGLAGFISGKTGLESAVVGRAGTAGAGRAFAGGLLKEAAGEQLEEVSPQLTTNLLASQYDGRDITQNVGRTMVETAVGAGPGSILSGGMDALSRRRQPDQLPPAPPPPAPNAQADLDTAVADLQSAVDPYVGIRQATTVDDAIAAAGAAAAAPVADPAGLSLAPIDPLPAPAPLTPEQRRAEAAGLVAQQLGLDAGTNVPPPLSQALSGDAPDVAPIREALADRALMAQVSFEDRQSLLGAANALANPSLPAASRQQLAQQAYSIIGQYQADTPVPGGSARYGAAVTDGLPATNMLPASRPAATPQAPLAFEPTAVEPTTELGAAPQRSFETIEPTGMVRALDEPAPSGSRRALTETEIPAAPGSPAVADTLNVNAAGQVGATEQQNAALLADDPGAELGRQRIAQGYTANPSKPTAPRPSKVNGAPAATLSDNQLKQIASNDSLPAITRRGASVELSYRQAEAPAAPIAAPATEPVATQGSALAQPTGGRVITSSAKLSTSRPQVPGSQHTIRDQDTDHTYTVVDPGQLGGQGKMLAQVSRVFGKKLVVFESETLQADGFVRDDDGGTVYVNSKSSVSPLAVFGHELTHLIKRDNAAAYSALEAVVQRNLAPEGMANFEKEYGAGANLEELTSDLTGNRFQEPKFWSDVFDEIVAANPEESRSIITRLAGALNKAVNAFLKVVRQPGFQADQYVKDLDAVKAAVKKAVSAYAVQQREPAMRLEAELMRAESQVNLAAGSAAPANDSQATIAASPARNPQVDTPEFKSFYEGSKVVDGQGRPVPLYRGMRGESIPDQGADTFTPQPGLYGTGVYMSSGTRRAGGYADGPNGQVYPVYSAVKNPIDADEFIERFGRSKRSPEESQRITDQLVSEGYDGVIERGGPGGYNEVVAFRGEQVKSAIGNRGSFDTSTSKITQSPARGVAASADDENRVAVVVGAKPGEFDWNFTRSDLKPPPFAAPTQRGPRLEKVGEAVYEVLRSSGFKKLAADAFGIQNLRVVPLHGSWLNKPEPSFALYGDGLTFEQADDLSKMLGFAFAQDATVVYQPTSEESPGDRPAVYLGNDKKLSPEQMKAVLSSAQAEGLDYSSTADGKAVKFLHFGSEEEFKELLEKTARIAKSAGLKYADVFNVKSKLNEAKDYTERPGRGAGKAVWFSDSAAGPSGLFGRTVNHVLVPYAKAVGSEGYRFAVSRFGERFGLSGEQQELIRSALIPKNGSAKATVDIASGKVKLEITGTGRNGKPSVTDILWALQNKSAQAGLIEPGDYSDQARKVIAEALADEVIHHIETAPTGKSAIGWYDRALKAAKKQYLSIFPEIGTDPDAEMVFDALLGIASQGNDVFSNSIFAARMYELRRGKEKMSLSQAVAALKGTFGGETVAIENNYLKLEELLDRNGYADMRKFFNKKDTVANINARLRADTTLYFKGKPLQVEGAADQIVTGWMVFGPKIGSFINNLHGDYSTLTADLWFSRTWNRILGYSFVHVPALEAEQFQRFQEAVIAEYGFSRDREGPIAPKRIDKNGKVSMPEFGTDMAALDDARVQEVLADPDEALKFATELEGVYRKGGYKQKSDLRRAAKNWVENRRDAEAAPRTDLERSFQQDTVETTQKIIRRRTGATITIADIQAALWYYEKEDLFKKLGGTNKKSEAADYAGAAEETIKLYNEGDLFYNKTDDRYVYGAKGDYLPGNNITPSRTREREAADITVAELRGRKVAMQVRIEDTGETGTLTMDAADSLTDIDERESAMQRLLECLRK